MRRLLFNKFLNIINLQYSFLLTSSCHYSDISLDIYKKIRHLTLFLLNLPFLHVDEQQKILDIISTVVIFSSGCYFGTNLPFFIFYFHSNGFCNATLFSPSFHNQPFCKQACACSQMCSFKTFLEKGIDSKFELGVALNASILS